MLRYIRNIFINRSYGKIMRLFPYKEELAEITRHKRKEFCRPQLSIPDIADTMQNLTVDEKGKAIYDYLWKERQRQDIKILSILVKEGLRFISSKFDDKNKRCVDVIYNTLFNEMDEEMASHVLQVISQINFAERQSRTPAAGIAVRDIFNYFLSRSKMRSHIEVMIDGRRHDIVIHGKDRDWNTSVKNCMRDRTNDAESPIQFFGQKIDCNNKTFRYFCENDVICVVLNPEGVRMAKKRAKKMGLRIKVYSLSEGMEKIYELVGILEDCER